MLKELDEAVKPGGEPPANLGQLTNARRTGREVKRPSDAKWVAVGSNEGAKIISRQDARRDVGSAGIGATLMLFPAWVFNSTTASR